MSEIEKPIGPFGNIWGKRFSFFSFWVILITLILAYIIKPEMQVGQDPNKPMSPIEEVIQNSAPFSNDDVKINRGDSAEEKDSLSNIQSTSEE